MDSLLLYKKINSLPEAMKAEVVDFIEFLESKSKAKDKSKSSSNRPQFGSGKDLFTIKENFDEPLADFKDYT